MDQRNQENKVIVSEPAKELKPDEMEKVNGAGQPVVLPRNEEKDRG